MTAHKRNQYRLVIIRDGNVITSGPMYLGEAARTLAALYEEGHESVTAVVGPRRRKATHDEAQRLAKRAREYVRE